MRQSPKWLLHWITYLAWKHLTKPAMKLLTIYSVTISQAISLASRARYRANKLKTLCHTTSVKVSLMQYKGEPKQLKRSLYLYYWLYTQSQYLCFVKKKLWKQISNWFVTGYCLEAWNIFSYNIQTHDLPDTYICICPWASCVYDIRQITHAHVITITYPQLTLVQEFSSNILRNEPVKLKLLYQRMC